MHPLVSQAGKNKGKAARMLANKISLAAKIDLFKGEEYKGYELLQNLEKDIKKFKAPRPLKYSQLNTPKIDIQQPCED